MRTLKVAVVAVVREKRVMLRIARLQSLLVYHSTSYYLLLPSHKALCPTDRTFKKKKDFQAIPPARERSLQPSSPVLQY